MLCALIITALLTLFVYKCLILAAKNQALEDRDKVIADLRQHLRNNADDKLMACIQCKYSGDKGDKGVYKVDES